MSEKKQFTVRMRETIERVYTVEAADKDEARAKAGNFEGDFSHDDGVVDWEVVSVTADED